MTQMPVFAGLTNRAEHVPLSMRMLRGSLWLGIAILALGLGVFAYAGSLIRYLADDYCFTSVLLGEGFFQAQVSWYLTTSSRVTVMGMVGLSELFGQDALRMIPGMVILVGCAGLYLTLRGLAAFFPVRIEREYLLIATLLVVFFAVLLAPNRLQSLYWRAGTLTYTFPIALGLVGMAASVQYLRWSSQTGIYSRGAQEWGPLLAGLIAFFAGACSETYAAVQTGFLMLVGFGCMLLLRGKIRKLTMAVTLSAWIGSLLAMAVMILSPANTARLAVMPATPSLPRLLAMALGFAWDYLRDSLRGQILANLALLGLSFGLSFAAAAALESRNPEGARKMGLQWEKTVVTLATIPLVCYLLVVCGMAPSAYGESAPPEARALMISRSVIVTATAAWGGVMGYAFYWLGEGLRKVLLASRTRRLILIGIFSLLWFYPLRAAWIVVDDLAPQVRWTQAWDARDELIRSSRAKGLVDLTVPALDSRSGVMELGEADLWVNGCAASYYGVRSIRAEE